MKDGRCRSALKPLFQPGSNASQMGIDFAYHSGHANPCQTLSPWQEARRGEFELTWRRTQDQRNDSIPCNLDVLDRSKDVHVPAQTSLSRTYQLPFSSNLDNSPSQTTYVSARTILVRLAFSIVNLVFPSCPAIRPIARDK